jgi:hypothetical protein
LLGYKPGFKSDDTFWDKAEELPGCFIIQRELEKALSGKPFFVNSNETGKPDKLPAVDYSDFLYYYELWDNFHYFGYPQNMDWTESPKWFNDVLKYFENSFIQVQNMIEEKAIKKAGQR